MSHNFIIQAHQGTLRWSSVKQLNSVQLPKKTFLGSPRHCVYRLCTLEDIPSSVDAKVGAVAHFFMHLRWKM